MPFEASTSKATVLYVEDDSNDILLLRHAFQKAESDCQLQIFSDSEEALAYLIGTDKFADRQQFALPHLALLDLKMPRVNGFELLTRIRREPTLRRLPVVVLSSSNHAIDVKQAYDSGANSYLVKPIDFKALVELVRYIHEYWIRLNHFPDFFQERATHHLSAVPIV